MVHLLRLLTSALVVALLLAACAMPGGQGEASPPAGRIMLWHGLPAGQEKALLDAVNRFDALHPDTDILVRAVPSEAQLVQEFTRAAASGLGADLLLLDSSHVPELLAAGWLAPIDEQVDAAGLEQYLATAVTTLRHSDRLYGLPVALDTQALFYDNRVVDQPPATLDQLLAEARAGRGVAMSSSFVNAFWGFRALGADFVDPDSGAVRVTPGPFVNWLTWLQAARGLPALFMEGSAADLQALLVDGQAAYYVGTAYELPALTAAMGNRLGVAPLPGGPGGSAGPFLTTRALLFNRNSSPRQAATALELARFLTNPEQQAALMRDAQWVPANLSTRIAPSLYPHVASIEAQARTALPWVGDPELVEALVLLDATFSRVLAGLASPADAAALLAEQDVQFGALAGASPPAPCRTSGAFHLAAVDEGPTRQLLRTLVDGFALACPNVRVELQLLAPQNAGALYGDGGAAPLAGDVVYSPQSATRYLAERGLAADISADVDRNLLQSLRPAALEALRREGRLLGLPVALRVQALYYNRSLVRNPPGTLEDLRTQAGSGVPIALDDTFLPGFWGIGAFGGTLFDQRGAFVLERQPFVDWLTWLAASRTEAGIELTSDRTTLRRQFRDGATAYYVGTPDEAADLRAGLGERLGLSMLPEGPQNAGQALLRVGNLVLSAAAEGDARAAGLAFMAYAADSDAQRRLAARLGVVPANAGAAVAEDAFVATFLRQSQDAQLLGDQRGLNVVAMLGDEALRQVLEEGRDPQAAVAEMYAQLARLDLAAEAPAGNPTPSATPSSTPSSTPAIP